MAEAKLSQCTGSVPRHDPWPPEKSALSHSLSIPALLRHQGLPGHCIPLPSVLSLQTSWSSRFLGFGLELWCFFWPFEKKNREGFDRYVQRSSGDGLPSRQMSAGHSLLSLPDVYLFNSYGKFWKTWKTSRVTFHPNTTANVKLQYCILNSMFERFYLQHVQLTCIIIYKETKLN